MFGTWLKAERERRGWSQRYLARLAEVTSQAINQLEKDPSRKPNERTEQGLAQAFGLSVAGMYQAAYGVPLDDDPVAALEAEGVAAQEVEEYRRLMVQLPEAKRQEAIRHLRFLLLEHRAEQAQRQQAKQGPRAGRQPAGEPDLDVEAQPPVADGRNDGQSA
jgi:transcriptional regulator with XRE-family HTH domain